MKSVDAVGKMKKVGLPNCSKNYQLWPYSRLLRFWTVLRLRESSDVRQKSPSIRSSIAFNFWIKVRFNHFCSNFEKQNGDCHLEESTPDELPSIAAGENGRQSGNRIMICIGLSTKFRQSEAFCEPLWQSLANKLISIPKRWLGSSF